MHGHLNFRYVQDIGMSRFIRCYGRGSGVYESMKFLLSTLNKLPPLESLFLSLNRS
jgi:hypothetical protein